MKTYVIKLETAREIIRARREQTGAAKKSLLEMRASIASKWERRRPGLSLNHPALVASLARVRFEGCEATGEKAEGLIKITALRDWLAAAPKGEQWAFLNFGAGRSSAPCGIRLQRGASGVALWLRESAQYRGNQAKPTHYVNSDDDAPAEAFGDVIVLAPTASGEIRLARCEAVGEK
jgi:hypothetical protein